MENNEYIEKYTESLSSILISQLTGEGVLDGQLLEVEELMEKWHASAPDYVADAVGQIADYPTVAVAWAMYFGMGAAAAWDSAWEEYEKIENIYLAMRDVRGFDYMDEYIVEKWLGMEIEGEEAERLHRIILGCSNTAISMIRREGFEPQSREAFYIFAATVKMFYRLGISIELRRRGYRYEKVCIENIMPASEIN